MLSMKICEKCYHCNGHSWRAIRDRDVIPFYWRWICYAVDEDSYVSEGDNPPKGCGYELEHALEMQNVNQEYLQELP